MKRIILVTLCCVFAFSGMVFAGGASEGGGGAAQKMNLRYGELNPAEHPITKGGYEFARLVSEGTQGRISIEIFPSSQLGNEREQMQSAQQGALDFFRANSGAMLDFGVKEMAIIALPFIFNSRDHMWKVLNGPIGQKIMDASTERGTRMISLAFFDDGARHIFTTKKPVRKLGDVKGMKLRVPQNEIFMEMISALGGSPTPISYGELYSSLQTGVVDGAENTIAGYASNAFYEPAPYITLDRHMSPPGLVIASQITWEQRLGDADRQLMTKAIKQASDKVTKETVAFEDTAIDDLKKKNVTVIEISDVADWQKAVLPLYTKYGVGFEGVIKDIQNTK
ncbi:MAG: TRAP transporter substrate-binding protein [Spirochaetia bacterium]|jgi:tripartite ATP-independent transporter DctP family solute receptor|nr:TRAP transporter substrate-binding protein [Spirochaetia bacterium]